MFYLAKVNRIKYNEVSFLAETFPELNTMYERMENTSKADPTYQGKVKRLNEYLKLQSISEEIVLEYKDIIGDEEFCEVKEFVSGKNILVDRDVLLLSKKINMGDVAKYKSSLIPRNFGCIFRMVENYNKGIEKAKNPQKSFMYRK